MSTVISPKKKKAKQRRTANTTTDKSPELKRGRYSKQRQDRMAAGLDWPIITWLGILHVGALAAPFCFSWSALAIVVVLHWLTGGIGICLGYHRLFTHSSFRTYPWLRAVIAFIGGLA